MAEQLPLKVGTSRGRVIDAARVYARRKSQGIGRAPSCIDRAWWDSKLSTVEDIVFEAFLRGLGVGLREDAVDGVQLEDE